MEISTILVVKEKISMKIIKAYIEMKKKEILVKSKLYGMILEIAEEKEDLIRVIKDLYKSLKGVPADELRKEFISKLAEIIHNSAKNERESEKEAV